MTDEELLGEVEIRFETKEDWRPFARRLLRRFERRGWLGPAHVQTMQEIIDTGTATPGHISALRRLIARKSCED